MKIVKTIQPKIVILTAVKYQSILHGRVFVMVKIEILVHFFILKSGDLSR